MLAWYTIFFHARLHTRILSRTHPFSPQHAHDTHTHLHSLSISLSHTPTHHQQQECISGTKPADRQGGRTGVRAFLYDVVNNARSGLDVDKLDYFKRCAS